MRAGLGNVRVVLLDELGAANHLFQLIDPAIDQANLFLRLLVLRVVLDITRLEGLLQPIGRLDEAGALNLELAF